MSPRERELARRPRLELISKIRERNTELSVAELKQLSVPELAARLAALEGA